ncbi:DNA ligase-1 [Nocardioides scoriae]|uniref:DNA ligase B n=1 Tax=Nocardioides scoriae TaxID=642780 RepID=A0A1H1Q082_9ACTN|nr:ATP-dependent DNA ligase [Nocardioides scoriae]SDS16888.1 DNA ligase-1 [Nocardioides scoriae]
MLLARLVEVSTQVASTRSRLAKRDLIAGLLREVTGDELDLVATYLSGTLRQRRTGLGWRGVAALPPPAATATVELLEVDAGLERIAALAGPGSAGARREAATSLFARLTAPEQEHLRNLVTGNVRQGALDSVVLDAIATAADVPLAEVRRAAMFSAPTGPIAVAALGGGAEALAGFSMLVGRPVRPMLAGTAPDVAAGVAKASPDAALAVDTKLDGIRIQVHKHGDEVLVFTRSLEEIGERLPQVVAVARSLPADDLVLDGEALALDETGRPRPFQETASGTATHGPSAAADAGVRPFFFDLLLDGPDSLVEVPTRERLARLDAVVPEEHRVARLVTDSPEAAQDFFTDVVAQGHEGVVLKRLDAPYDAGRRGSAWVKVKPRHTLDLVVLGVEWGSGRRQGWLSNLHLGARDDRPGHEGFVMLGKTFKGLTDELLAWQTERFLALESRRTTGTVFVRPEQVVEIAFDGVQRSTRYPGGVALRFARVLRYRDDKPADEVDGVSALRALVPGGAP